MLNRSDNMMWSQLFRLSRDRKVSYQRQLREMIVSAILDDKLPLEVPLPSSRELARHLGIARNTVVLAYQQLIDEGYLVARERSGYYIDKTMLEGRVRVDPVHLDGEHQPPDWNRHIKFHPSQQRNIVKPLDWKQYPYPFLFGQLDPDLFPRQALSVSDIRDVTPDRIDIDDPLLIEQIQARILPRRGVWAARDEILITMGAQQALYILADLLIEKGTRVGMENPGYPDARNIFELKSPRMIPLAVDDRGVVPGKDLNSCEFIYTTPSHQSPTTVTMPLEARLPDYRGRLRERDQLCRRTDAGAEKPRRQRPRYLCRQSVENAGARAAPRLHGRAESPDRRGTGAASPDGAASTGQQPAHRRAVPVDGASRLADSPPQPDLPGPLGGHGQGAQPAFTRIIAHPVVRRDFLLGRGSRQPRYAPAQGKGAQRRYPDRVG
jgi:hypothetical protein